MTQVAPAPAETLSTEDALLAAMDRQARRFVEMLDDERVDDEGNLIISIEMRFKLFDKGQSWLRERAKLRPATDEKEGSGITDMRASMNDPNFVSTLEQVMFERGFVKVPEKKNGRPRNEDKPIRERYKAFKQGATETDQRHDDSGWQDELSVPKEEDGED